MQIDIRKSIINNFLDLDVSDIKSSIEEAIVENEEITLPGLGVLFEIIWKCSDDDVRNLILNLIKNNIKNNR